MPTDDKSDAILVQHRGTVTFQGTAEDMARWGAASCDGERNLMSERAGWNDAIAWLEKHLADYVSQHGSYDHSTGVTEFPDGGEYAGSIEILIDGMRLAMPATPDQTPAVEPVALTHTNWPTNPRAMRRGRIKTRKSQAPGVTQAEVTNAAHVLSYWWNAHINSPLVGEQDERIHAVIEAICAEKDNPYNAFEAAIKAITGEPTNKADHQRKFQMSSRRPQLNVESTHLPVDDLIFHVQIQTLHLNEAISRANDAGIKVGIEIETERHQVRAMPAAFVVHNRVRTIFGHEEPSPSWWSRILQAFE